MSGCILCFEICPYRTKFFVVCANSFGILTSSVGCSCFVRLRIIMSYRPYRNIYILSVRSIIKVSRIFVRRRLMSVSDSK